VPVFLYKNLIEYNDSSRSKRLKAQKEIYTERNQVMCGEKVLCP
jgi:hypothetical protein